MKTKTFRCDINKTNYSQVNNVIEGNSACNITSMVQALDYMGYKLPEDELFPKFKQAEDKLMYFCKTDKDVLNFYKEKMPAMYNQFIKERESQKNLPIEKCKFIDSYPPNEVHMVLSYAVNKFIGCNATYFKELASIDEIIEQLTMSKPVVISVKFGNLNHILTLVGVELYEKGNEWKVSKFFADDTYGKFNFETGKYEKVSGNDCEFTYEQLVPCMKNLSNKDKKYAHFFNNPAAVI